MGIWDLDLATGRLLALRRPSHWQPKGSDLQRSLKISSFREPLQKPAAM